MAIAVGKEYLLASWMLCRSCCTIPRYLHKTDGTTCSSTDSQGPSWGPSEAVRVAGRKQRLAVAMCKESLMDSERPSSITGVTASRGHLHRKCQDHLQQYRKIQKITP